jgi:hypothetical protein
MADDIDLAGAVDLHTHVGPSAFDRRVDGLECAMEVAEAGMDAVVMKEHHLPTAAGTYYVERLLEREDADVTPVGSVVLNYCNGGFNPFVVQTAIDAGAGVVWGPTLDARNHAAKTGELGGFLGVETGRAYEGKEGIEAFDGKGRLREEVRRSVETVVDEDVVLALGHLSNEETLAIVEHVADMGHDKILIDHPSYHVTDLSSSQQQELAALGATLNFPFLSVSEEYGWASPGEIADSIRAVGVDDCVVSSDVGQASTPTVPDSLRRLGRKLHDEGLSAAELDVLLRDNPKRLLGMA